MKKLLVTAISMLMLPTAVLAAGVLISTATGPVSSTNPLPVTGTVTGGSTTGNVADAVADSGNPVKIGGIYEATLPTYATGQRANAHMGTRGSLSVQLMAPDSGFSVAAQADNADGLAVGSSANKLIVATRTYLYNGTTWDRALTCTSQTSATITAAATTQIVALQASQQIRVCAYQIGIATTGTFRFTQGTGTNCATGAAGVTPATNLTAGNVVNMNAPGGSSLFRTGAGNALCVEAITGNVQVFLSYAQF